MELMGVVWQTEFVCSEINKPWLEINIAGAWSQINTTINEFKDVGCKMAAITIRRYRAVGLIMQIKSSDGVIKKTASSHRT